jgi:hypothetical protein
MAETNGDGRKRIVEAEVFVLRDRHCEQRAVLGTAEQGESHAFFKLLPRCGSRIIPRLGRTLEG